MIFFKKYVFMREKSLFVSLALLKLVRRLYIVSFAFFFTLKNDEYQKQHVKGLQLNFKALLKQITTVFVSN